MNAIITLGSETPSGSDYAYIRIEKFCTVRYVLFSASVANKTILEVIWNEISPALLSGTLITFLL